MSQYLTKSIFIWGLFFLGGVLKAHEMPDTVFASQQMHQKKINDILKTISSKDFKNSISFLLSFKGRISDGENIRMSGNSDSVYHHIKSIKIRIQNLLDSMIVYEKASHFYAQTLLKNKDISLQAKFLFFENYYDTNLFFLDSWIFLLKKEILTNSEFQIIPQYVENMSFPRGRTWRDWHFYKDFLKTLIDAKKYIQKEKSILRQFKILYYETKKGKN